MRPAFLLRQRRSLLMPLDPSKRSPSFGSPLKRPFPQSRSVSSSSSTAADQEALRPGKVPKLEDAHSPTIFASSTSTLPSTSGSSRRKPSSSLLARMPPTGPSQLSSGKGKRGKAQAALALKAPILEPTYDLEYIEEHYKTEQLKQQWFDNPKAAVANWMSNKYKSTPLYESVQGLNSNRKAIWRTTARIDIKNLRMEAYGDHQNRKDSEKLAALSLLYQLIDAGLLGQPSKGRQAELEPELSPMQATLSDGSLVDFDKGRQFMDYYCRRFGFGKPDITSVALNSRGQKTYWQAEMTVGGRKIGFATGPNKKAASMACYIDVTKYLEECDASIWEEFLKDAKTGKDLGLAPRVLFSIDDSLQEQVEDLCAEIRKSTLYKKRPKTEMAPGDAPPEPEQSQIPTGPRYPDRRPVSPEFLRKKSEVLKQRRDRYLQDEKMAKMRETRAALPVYTKSEELLKHIQEHDVTICMAATGSGKTTQIPQLILDEWTERGEGAKCNIVCTQPRRIAAISVAGRVAKERGENVGRGHSIGYQVRFEANLPDEHGAVTFCTTGIFLKRMQSQLLGGGSAGRSLDDVTHVLVDEVHERDVDTDLLLVVLKRLLADRKARNLPIKIVLMSATIDPKLFQEYFREDDGQPASVIDIPGRAFPVQKNYLDDYAHMLAGHHDSAWVFQEKSVQKYLRFQLGDDAPVPRLPAPSGRPRSSDVVSDADDHSAKDIKDDELELPVPFIALTIAHVLRNSDDGHVLVFLPGWDDIMAVQRCLLNARSLLGMNFNDQSRYRIHLLHSSIPVAEQQAIFEPPPAGIRRIILSTNIAETSVTIPDVVYVVDSAKVKEQRYDPERHISSLVSAWVGSSNLNQRAGRAGRHRPGEYYGILSKQFAEKLHPYQLVEMKRVDLSNVVMHVKALNFSGMTVEEVLAETIEPPAPDRVVSAMNSLQMVGALDEQHNLTSLGRVLLQIPIDVQMGRMVLFGSFFRCLDHAITLAAILTNRDPFVAPMHLKAEASAKKNSFTTEDFRSDALATLYAYNAWWDLQKQGNYVSANRFCSENFLAKPALLTIQRIKEHLLKSLFDAGVIDVSAGGDVVGPAGPRRGDRSIVPSALNVNANSRPLLAALIAIATQPKFAIRTGGKTYRTQHDKTVFIHPSSVNHRKREILENEPNAVITEKQIIAYAEKRQNISAGSTQAQMFLVTTTRLDPLTYLLFGAYHVDVTARGLECDEWLPIVGRADALDEAERLKVMMEACMLRVFEGIIARSVTRSRRSVRAPGDERESESGDEDEGPVDGSLSGIEIKELDLMTRDIVNILNNYSRYRIANQSHHNSRPGTPMDSPSSGPSRLPGFSGGSRSGYSTPHNMAYNSRPSTPSPLWKRL
ncbi:P-loop containing nucleoside triphosphate hydrolase protein [Laetiporus sulphureus 93-53]|uniref:p-loop containing nucleoside triphosphate hydrolase protein n=1 Tax=Laetiporus sulphureus 93-53 TaxID=1314785 RepID=A0A165CFD9_9APHY|nr:P-loop containing nucleoside triphosphate hydrolase protein [Laetiporus sulphureus 93-53]KZT02710.1 P-loop containing nucleoside triphosphate hydrolase protein [Laetiporus sulphureus 93-53]